MLPRPCGGSLRCEVCASLRIRTLVSRLEATNSGSAADVAEREAAGAELRLLREKWPALA